MPIICNSPPASRCLNESTFLIFPSSVVCDPIAGCQYDSQQVACADCQNTCGVICTDKANGTSCDDANPCTLSSACIDGECRPDEIITCNAPPTECHQPGTCNLKDGECTYVLKNPGAPCSSDNNPCTDDVCDATGACVHNNNNSPCDDGIFCNGTDTCEAATCNLHSGNPCPSADGDSNCAESCDETADNCLAADPYGATCDDGNAATPADQCNNAGICMGGGLRSC
ncbi:MAG: hypothetical protein R3C68_17995, partial [Myxococcota bacterium]